VGSPSISSPRILNRLSLQNTGQLYRFFKQNIGLNDSEIARIEQGKAVAKVLDSSTPSQVFVFGAVFINAQPSGYVRLSGDLDRLKSLPNYLALQRFSDPRQPSDLRGFGIEADDVDDLKNCKPGNKENTMATFTDFFGAGL